MFPVCLGSVCKDAWGGSGGKILLFHNLETRRMCSVAFTFQPNRPRINWIGSMLDLRDGPDAVSKMFFLVSTRRFLHFELAPCGVRFKKIRSLP